MTFIIQMGRLCPHYLADDFLVQDPALATRFASIPDALAEVSKLAKFNARNLRVRRFHNGVVTNLKE